MSNGGDIAAEVAAGLAEAILATGDATFQVTLTRPAAEVDADAGTPWGDAATGSAEAPDTWDIVAVDKGPMTRYSRADDGSLIARTVRVLMVAATGEAPQMGDTITLPDGTFAVLFVKTINPAGVPLMHEVELRI